MNQIHLVRAALAGAATGLRSTSGVGALVESSSSGLPLALTSTPARAVAGLAVAGELVVDKLPNTPSRLDPPGLLARVALASAAGAVIARASERPMVPGAVVAAIAAAASARVGHDIRQRASAYVPPIAAAVAEDVVALTLAVGAARSAG
jgi:uncharacterized membrane protein